MGLRPDEFDVLLFTKGINVFKQVLILYNFTGSFAKDYLVKGLGAFLRHKSSQP